MVLVYTLALDDGNSITLINMHTIEDTKNKSTDSIGKQYCLSTDNKTILMAMNKLILDKHIFIQNKKGNYAIQ